MKKLLLKFTAVLLTAVFIVSVSSCGTIRRGTNSEKLVTIMSSQPIQFEVLDRNDNVVGSGVTPGTVRLHESGVGGARYVIRFTTPAGEEMTQDIPRRVSPRGGVFGWVFVNTISTVGVGYIIDAVTGAMWVIPEQVLLEGFDHTGRFDGSELIIVSSLDEINPAIREHLVYAGELIAVE